jgi:exopolysaccharide production protein ExoZ
MATVARAKCRMLSVCHVAKVPRGQVSKQLNTIQGLRAVAAAAVVLHHDLAVLIQKAGYAMEFSVLGASGVDLFFVISGFVMIYTHAAG